MAQKKQRHLAKLSDYKWYTCPHRGFYDADKKLGLWKLFML
jgi:hypothetical protein